MCFPEQRHTLCAIHDTGLEYPYHRLVAAVFRPSHGVLPVELCGFLFTRPGIAVHFLVTHAFEKEEKSCPSHVFERYREVDGSGQPCRGHETIGDISMGNERLDVVTNDSVLN
jgi:hypothetical protein